jgi:hypothetical protein
MLDVKSPITIASAEEFVRLRSSENPEEYNLASWGSASDEVWLEVIHNHPEYARWVAHNKSISLEVIRILAAHPDDAVRSFIAAKRKTPTDLLWLLAKDQVDSVRARVANNAKTPTEILGFLLNDPWKNVRERAWQRLEAIKLKNP